MSYFVILLSLTFLCNIRNIVIQLTGRKAVADHEYSIHTVCSLAGLHIQTWIMRSYSLPDRIGGSWYDIAGSFLPRDWLARQYQHEF